MQAFILAAGFGTRLRPITNTVPKPLVPIDGVPLLEFHVAQLKKHGVDNVIINMSYLADQLEDYVRGRDQFGFPHMYISREEPEPLGTSGALKFVEDRLEDPLIVSYGDNFTFPDYTAMWEQHQASDADVTIALYQETHIESKGMALLEGNRITGFIEKPKPEQVVSHWANAAVYILNKSVVTSLVPKGFSDFGLDIFPRLLSQGGRIDAFLFSDDAVHIDIGTHEKLLEAEQALKRHPELLDRVYRANVQNI